MTKSETIVISRGRKPLAKLAPYDEPGARPRVGEVMDARFVITHNIADFLGSDSMGLRAITPAAAFNLIRP